MPLDDPADRADGADGADGGRPAERAAPAGRPRIAVPGRFSASASALRYAAVVNARALLTGVLRAGGEPLTVLPRPLPTGPDRVDDELDAALGWADGILLPGGGDLDPARYGQERASDDVYDVDEEQDGFDLAVARWALARGVPLLAVCRGLQVVNVALGGTLLQHMDSPHRHRVHEVRLDAGPVADLLGGCVEVSCYHHQRVERLGDGLRVVGRAEDGTPEAFDLPGAPGWFLGVQWHPEDLAGGEDARAMAHRAVFAGLVAASQVSRASA